MLPVLHGPSPDDDRPPSPSTPGPAGKRANGTVRGSPWDPNIVFDTPPFTPDQAAKLMADGAFIALTEFGKQPEPTNFLSEMIQVCRLQVSFLGNIGMIDTPTRRRFVGALDAHLAFLDTQPDPDSYGVEAVDSSKFMSRPEPMSIGAYWEQYNFSNVDAEEKLSTAFSLGNGWDYMKSWWEYVKSTEDKVWKSANFLVFALAMLGIAGPWVLPFVGSSMPSGVTKLFSGEFNILRNIESEITRAWTGATATSAQVVQERYQRAHQMAPRCLNVFWIPTTCEAGVSVAERMAYTGILADIAREVYTGSFRMKVGGFAGLVGMLGADVLLRYREDRCRKWLVKNDDNTRKNWRKKIDSILGVYVGFNVPEASQLVIDIRIASDGWRDALSTIEDVKTEPDPCGKVYNSVQPFLVEFQRIMNELKAAPFLLDDALKASLLSWVESNVQFQSANNKQTLQGVPGAQAIVLRSRHLFTRIFTCFFGQQHTPIQAATVDLYTLDLRNLTSIMNQVKSSGMLSPGTTAILDALESQAMYAGVHCPHNPGGGGGGGGGGGPGGGGPGGGGGGDGRRICHDQAGNEYPEPDPVPGYIWVCREGHKEYPWTPIRIHGGGLPQPPPPKPPPKPRTPDLPLPDDGGAGSSSADDDMRGATSGESGKSSAKQVVSNFANTIKELGMDGKRRPYRSRTPGRATRAPASAVGGMPTIDEIIDRFKASRV